MAADAGPRCFVDLHCHSAASFDSLSKPADLVRLAAERGLTHLAITDHERIDGALAARDLAPPELTVIVGEEIRSADGDLLGLFLEHTV
ncbi:MAG: PHP domain-containing protein, partial [Candidatus Limnocylindrales bacterium]